MMKKSISLQSRSRFGLLCLAAAATLSLASCGSSTSKPSASSTPAYSNANLTGGYVFTASGTDSSDGDYFVAGSFEADGKGNITSGVADYNLGSGVDPAVAFTGTYSVNNTGSGSVTITDGKGVQDTFTVFLSNSATTPSAVSAFDTTGTGVLLPTVTPPSTLAGTYTFSLSGEGHGTVNASGSFTTNASGTITAGTETYTDGGATASIGSLTGYLLPIQNDRGYAVIGGITFSYYVGAQNQLTLAGLDDRTLLHGTAQKTS